MAARVQGGDLLQLPLAVARLRTSWATQFVERALLAIVVLGAVARVLGVAQCFTRANKERVEELLDTLSSLGKARELADGRFVAV